MRHSEEGFRQITGNNTFRKEKAHGLFYGRKKGGGND